MNFMISKKPRLFFSRKWGWSAEKPSTFIRFGSLIHFKFLIRKKLRSSARAQGSPFVPLVLPRLNLRIHSLPNLRFGKACQIIDLTTQSSFPTQIFDWGTKGLPNRRFGKNGCQIKDLTCQIKDSGTIGLPNRRFGKNGKTEGSGRIENSKNHVKSSIWAGTSNLRFDSQISDLGKRDSSICAVTGRAFAVSLFWAPKVLFSKNSRQKEKFQRTSKFLTNSLNPPFNEKGVKIPSLSPEEFYLKKAKNFYSSYSKLYEINQIGINLASPERIRQWAEKILPNHKIIGRVTNANTLHYKSFKPQKGGLFCERIFGPLKDFECACGKSQKRMDQPLGSVPLLVQPLGLSLASKFAKSHSEDLGFSNASQPSSTLSGGLKDSSNVPLVFPVGSREEDLGGVGKEVGEGNEALEDLSSSEERKFCPDCDVEYTWSIIRRYQLGYIQLIAPVTHLWYLKGTPSYLSLLLNMKKRDLEAIIYCSESMTLEAAWNHKSLLSESPSNLFLSWQKMAKVQQQQGSLFSPSISKSSKEKQSKIEKRRKTAIQFFNQRLKETYAKKVNQKTLPDQNATLSPKIADVKFENKFFPESETSSRESKNALDSKNWSQVRERERKSLLPQRLNNWRERSKSASQSSIGKAYQIEEFSSTEGIRKSKIGNGQVIKSKLYTLPRSIPQSWNGRKSKDPKFGEHISSSFFGEMQMASPEMSSDSLIKKKESELASETTIGNNKEFIIPLQTRFSSTRAKLRVTSSSNNFNNNRSKVSPSILKEYKIIPIPFYILSKLKYLSQKKALFLFLQQIWKLFYKTSYLVAHKKARQILNKTSVSIPDNLCLEKNLQNNVERAKVQQNRTPFKKFLANQATQNFVKRKLKLIRSKSRFTTLQSFKKSSFNKKNSLEFSVKPFKKSTFLFPNKTERNFSVFLTLIKNYFKKYVLQSIFNRTTTPKSKYSLLKDSNTKKIAFFKATNLSNDILKGSKYLMQLLAAEIAKKIIRLELKCTLKQKFLKDIFSQTDTQSSERNVFFQSTNSLFSDNSTFLSHLISQTSQDVINKSPDKDYSASPFSKNSNRNVHSFSWKQTSNLESHSKSALWKQTGSKKLKTRLEHQAEMRSISNPSLEVSRHSITMLIKKRARLKNEIFNLKVKNLKLHYPTILPQQSNFTKITEEKSIYNNVHTLSHRFNWKKEKDWRSFFFYLSASADYEDRPIPHYKNQIPNPDTSTLVGAGILQKLLGEFNLEELKKMDKQNRIQLAELTKEMNELKKFVRLGISDKSDELRYREILQERNKLISRLKLTRVLYQKKSNPESMVLSTLPVLPPDLRPIIKIDGQIAASDLNRFYQRILYRNERLKKFLKDPATRYSYEMKFTQRLLQESVDNLIANGKGKVAAEKDSRGRPLKSLSDILKGKEGRFRQHLLGKRVDYSGRSVIVVGPKLKIHQCGLPKEMALELFLPFLLKRLIHSKMARTVIGAKTILQTNQTLTLEILNEVMQNHPILLNRAPTLHRLGIQAFQAKLVEGRAILLHPLVCPAFNADFDGDQMAVHVPITIEARAEAWKLMFSRGNLLSPATGDPILLPSQDMVLGCYYLTTESFKYDAFSNIYFSNVQQVMRAYYQGALPQKMHLHSIIWLNYPVFECPTKILENDHDNEEPIEIRIEKQGYWKEISKKTQQRFDKNDKLISRYIRTTIGRIIFNRIIQDCITPFSTKSKKFL